MQTYYKSIMIKTLHLSGSKFLDKPIEIEGFIHELNDVDCIIPSDTIKGRIEDNGYMLEFKATKEESKYPLSIENAHHGLKYSFLENTNVTIRGIPVYQRNSRFPILSIHEIGTKSKHVRII